MVGSNKGNEQIPVPDKRTGDDDSDRTLLPMLVAGLVLIVIGAGIIMTFV